MTIQRYLIAHFRLAMVNPGIGHMGQNPEFLTKLLIRLRTENLGGFYQQKNGIWVNDLCSRADQGKNRRL
jgi:hypothetical protein